MEMKEIPIKKYVSYLFGISILLFILNKLYLRPWILEHESSGLLLIFTYSIPNLIEAIVGTLILTGILLQLRQSFNEQMGTIKEINFRVLAVVIAAVYVISQELKFHNLGGNNVYDINDIIASIVGLIGTYLVIQFFGFTEQPKKN